ncbi:asparaginase [Lujinxingia litoralis]|nr:asparaginase [Lujinxingia litoralis]
MPRVLILHTGGTLGMSGSPLYPDAYATRLTEAVPELEALADIETRIIFNLDSSDMGPEHWAVLASEIDASRDDFDGFVIVHGTDTMAYSAAALSFALMNLGKPVILTGAQRPLGALRTDARRNLADAVELATRQIPEVGICFDGILVRGTRATKSHANDYRAFDSPGTEPIARLGVDIELSEGLRPVAGAYTFRPAFDPAVMMMHVTPGLRPELFEPVIASGALRGLVLAAYGMGTIPAREPDMTAFVRRAVASGVEVLVITQAAGRIDLGLYENSRRLADAGAIGGGGLHGEAAVTKMMHALANFEAREERRAYLQSDVAGERG